MRGAGARRSTSVGLPAAKWISELGLWDAGKVLSHTHTHSSSLLRVCDECARAAQVASLASRSHSKFGVRLALLAREKKIRINFAPAVQICSCNVIVKLSGSAHTSLCLSPHLSVTLPLSLTPFLSLYATHKSLIKFCNFSNMHLTFLPSNSSTLCRAIYSSLTLPLPLSLTFCKTGLACKTIKVTQQFSLDLIKFFPMQSESSSERERERLKSSARLIEASGIY